MKNNLLISRKKPHSALAFIILAVLVVSATSLFQSAAQAQSPNLALNRPVTCSSVENAGTACANAVDGNTTTRWASAFSDPQWIRVDLGTTNAIGRIVLRWEAAYGKAYQLQVSNDGATWTNIYTTTTGDGGVDDITVSGTGRYVRMMGTARATQYGYSLWEFEVYGSGPTPTPTSTATPTVTSCPLPTPESLRVEPVTSPTTQLSQVVTVYIGRGEAVTVTTESGVFAVTGAFNAFTTPALVNVSLLPNTTHNLRVTGRVSQLGCYPSYTLSTTVDKNGAPLVIVQQPSTPTPTNTAIPGDLGYGSVHGIVTNMFSGAPIAGALITCSHTSFTSPSLCSGTRTTAADGSYSFDNVFFHDTDTITVNAQAPGFVSQSTQQSFFTTPNMTANFQMMMGTPTITPSPTNTQLATLPDLVVQSMSISGNQSCFDSGFQLGVRVTVANAGTGNAGAFVVTVNGAQQTVSGGLTAGQNTSLFFPGYNSGTPNTATVDSTNLITESNENNNTLSQQLPIPTAPPPCATLTPTNTQTSPQPDLVVTSVKGGREMSGSCALNLNIGINVTVQNSGSANAGSFLVEVNNNTGARKTVSGLAAGQSTTVWFNLSPQPITNTATVDVTNLVAESNESNNTLTVQASGTATPTGTPPVACTSTPTPTNTSVTPTPTNTPVPGGNLALNKPVTCSSVENAGTACANAVDGNTGTRWGSTFSDPQWIRVDLGATHTINRIVLRWEAAYGKSYQLQTSNDGTNWTTIYSTTTGDGGIDDLTGLSGSGRYVRMNGTVRATQYGYSLWEFEVY